MTILGDWWTQSQRPVLKAGRGVTADVETADLAALSVTSEKASRNLVTRTFVVVMDPPEPSGLLQGGSSLGGWSSAYTLWRAFVPVTIQRVQAFVLQSYQHACNDSLTLYGNAGTSIGDIYFCGQSTAIAGGTRVAGGNLNLVNLPACADIMLKYSASTCSIPVPIAIQLDYVTSQ